MLATNRLPRFVDRTDGVWRRLIVFMFNVQIALERQDPSLLKKLKAELPGILNWALIGLCMLRQQRRFPEVEACTVALQSYRLDSNPTMQFLQEFVVHDSTSTLHCAKLFQCYKSWIRENGYRALGVSEFGKELDRTYTTERIRVTTAKERQWHYDGLRGIPHLDYPSSQYL